MCMLGENVRKIIIKLTYNARAQTHSFIIDFNEKNPLCVRLTPSSTYNLVLLCDV